MSSVDSHGIMTALQQGDRPSRDRTLPRHTATRRVAGRGGIDEWRLGVPRFHRPNPCFLPQTRFSGDRRGRLRADRLLMKTCRAAVRANYGSCRQGWVTGPAAGSGCGRPVNRLAFRINGHLTDCKKLPRKVPLYDRCRAPGPRRKGAFSLAIVEIDAHKRSHTFGAIDDSGRRLGEKVSKTSSVGHLEAIRWARSKFGADITWAVEDCRHVSRLLEQDLLTAGYSVIRVPTRLMARTRASARTVGKSDPIDALAIARAALREPNLPTAYTDQTSRDLKLLVDRREDLIGQRTATISRLLWRLH
jgi:Transposase